MKWKLFTAVTMMCLLFSISLKSQKKAGAESELRNFAFYDSVIRKFYFTNVDSGLFYAIKAIDFARSVNNIKKETEYLNNAGEAYRGIGDFPASLEMQFRALDNNIMSGDKFGEARTYSFIGFTFTEFEEGRTAINYFQRADYIIDSLQESGNIRVQDTIINLKVFGSFNASNKGSAYESIGMLDSAIYCQEYARSHFKEAYNGPLKSLILTRIGNVFNKLGKYDVALQYYYTSLENAYLVGELVNPTRIKNRISATYLSIGKYDSSIFYARSAYQESMAKSFNLELFHAADQLVKLFRQKNVSDSVIFYHDVSTAVKDSLFGPQKFRKLQLLILKKQQQQQDILRQKDQVTNRSRMIMLAALLTVVLVTALALFRNNRLKQKANLLLQDQKLQLQQTLNKLTAAQKQLIQSEKMASLGELTAGVAHEIQNPLNFVNNFSDLNSELLEDLRDANQKNDNKEIEKITDQLKENESKINYHGKRADAIVKNMLQHSRTGTILKESTDINRLVDEYVRLAYHGMRAKDKSFNVELDLSYDPAIGLVNIIPQDIGRVLLNILNNAFYTLNEKQHIQTVNYQPTLTLSTLMESTDKSGHKVVISITDNGLGIPPSIQEKIFQPFFTTKPTGEGTGLGLSLSYDIITQGHGGKLHIHSVPGEFTTFTIELPS